MKLNKAKEIVVEYMHPEIKDLGWYPHNMPDYSSPDSLIPVWAKLIEEDYIEFNILVDPNGALMDWYTMDDLNLKCRHSAPSIKDTILISTAKAIQEIDNKNKELDNE